MDFLVRRYLCVAAMLLVPVFSWGFQVQLGVAAQWYDYQEIEAGRELNRETGVLPTVSVLTEGPLVGGWQWSADIAYGYGSVKYDGETQTGEPFLSTTDIVHIRWHTGVDYCFNACVTQVGAGLGQYQLDRGIRGKGDVMGLDEQFRWYEWTASLSQALAKSAPERWRLGAQLFQARNGELEVDLRPAGFSEVMLPLPNALGYRIHLEHQWRGSETLPLTLRLEHEYRGLKQSDSVPIGGSRSISLPENESRHWQLSLLVGF
ncbi:MAG: hypothetical protein CVV10_02260 [Gammaproteobacteria bacterium HGW-Gammaproteobacteria-14]|nr:MAG: hypothetical protein CVV10_02260 [Gammaproteobacteria bacterium HGW-Gammaproteobacteria-14]